jgi:hypothetical protein
LGSGVSGRLVGGFVARVGFSGWEAAITGGSSNSTANNIYGNEQDAFWNSVEGMIEKHKAAGEGPEG